VTQYWATFELPGIEYGQNVRMVQRRSYLCLALEPTMRTRIGLLIAAGRFSHCLLEASTSDFTAFSRLPGGRLTESSL
jgi:hypothetical protein